MTRDLIAYVAKHPTKIASLIELSTADIEWNGDAISF